MELHECEGNVLIAKAAEEKFKKHLAEYEPKDKLLAELTEELKKIFCCVKVPYVYVPKKPWYLFFKKDREVIEEVNVQIKHFPATYPRKDVYGEPYNGILLSLTPRQHYVIEVGFEQYYYFNQEYSYPRKGIKTKQEVVLKIAETINEYIENTKLGKRTY